MVDCSTANHLFRMRVLSSFTASYLFLGSLMFSIVVWQLVWLWARCSLHIPDPKSSFSFGASLSERLWFLLLWRGDWDIAWKQTLYSCNIWNEGMSASSELGLLKTIRWRWSNLELMCGSFSFEGLLGYFMKTNRALLFSSNIFLSHDLSF